MEALVKQHMGLERQDKCTVLPPHHWIRGGFYVCVMVEVNSGCRKVIFRCPIPHWPTILALYISSSDFHCFLTMSVTCRGIKCILRAWCWSIWVRK